MLTSPAVQLALYNQLAGELPPWTHQANDRIAKMPLPMPTNRSGRPGDALRTHMITPMPPGSSGEGRERTSLAHTKRPWRPRPGNGVPPRVREATDEP